MKKLSILLLLAISIFSCKNEQKNLKDGLYAEIKTTKGNILLQLDCAKAPITVANFVTLVEGKNTFVDEKHKGKPFYDGLLFHRVIPNFMCQGGDPNADGSGGAGYNFKDEFTDLKFDNGGILAMANSGPGTNSSQFFITDSATPWLEGKHTIFGHVVDYKMDIITKIAQNDVINSIKIIRKGDEAKKFDAVKIFSDYFAGQADDLKKQALIDAENKKNFDANFKATLDKKVAELALIKKNATKSSTGLQYKLVKKGAGKKPVNGATVYVHYAGFLENGTLFDSSIESIAKQFGKFDQTRSDAHQYIPLQCVAGKYQFIPGFNEGVSKMNFGDKIVLFIPSNLAYGEAGAGADIPPNANIIFEVELLENMPQ